MIGLGPAYFLNLVGIQTAGHMDATVDTLTEVMDIATGVVGKSWLKEACRQAWKAYRAAEEQTDKYWIGVR